MKTLRHLVSLTCLLSLLPAGCAPRRAAPAGTLPPAQANAKVPISLAPSGAAPVGSQTPAVSRAGELRGIWLHDPRGVDWQRVMAELYAAHMNAIFVKFSTGGAAYYRSEVLPGSFYSGRDEAALCLAAARRYGIQVHAWRVCFQMKDAPAESQQRAIREGRVQLDRRGQVLRPSYHAPVLCPSHDWNRSLEVRATVELATKYPFDGVHLDYLRWIDAEPCCCANCKKRFCRDTHSTVASWPRDVMKGGRLAQVFLSWREQIMTRMVGEISPAVRRARTSTRISAAVWPELASVRRDRGQNWKAWVDAGWLDFICPMNYATDPAMFAKRLAEERVLVGGRVPVYVGIAGYKCANGSQLQQLVAQAQRGGANGWVIFNYDDRFRAQLLPYLRN
ncbi:MAG: family 10 glycosylhydrolase [Verrucomicrobia bacterium]|nr:family 10 glycosylhydrolase [Verrucomicrobiota bacterium]